jgi:hypothetical protein
MHTACLIVGTAMLSLGSCVIGIRGQDVQRAVAAAGFMISGAILIAAGVL